MSFPSLDNFFLGSRKDVASVIASLAKQSVKYSSEATCLLSSRDYFIATALCKDFLFVIPAKAGINLMSYYAVPIVSLNNVEHVFASEMKCSESICSHN